MATFKQMSDDLKICPYNPLHKVSARRLQQHIVKCSKNPKNPKLLECPFNALHRISTEQYKQHILVCKDGRQAIREVVSQTQIQEKNNPVEDQSTENNIHNQEWGQDLDERQSFVIKGLVEDNRSDASDDNSKEFRFKTNIEIQCMKRKERKAYYKLMVKKVREAKNLEIKNETKKHSKTLSSKNTTSGREQSFQTSTSDSTYLKSKPSVANDVRNENTKRCHKFGGIGRGSSPSLSGRAVPIIGVGRGENANINSNDSIGIQLKRVREDDLTDKSFKRFSS